MTLVLEDLQIPGYERVVKISDPSVALTAIIAIHSTALGPTLGGIRMYPYESFDDALTDVLRLAKGMTYKSALSQCGTGGGKSVIIGNPELHKTEGLLLSFGRAVDKLMGQYICAEDVGITPEDVSVINETTKYVVGMQKEHSSGNPAPYTAWGTFRGVQASLQHVYGSDRLDGRTIAIQGLGSVGLHLADMLFWHGAKLIVADINPKKETFAKTKYEAEILPAEEIHAAPCDVFAPCALGAILNDKTIPELRTRIVAGCANNQLLEERHARSLKHRGVLYAPDFVINAGGLINVTVELEKEGYSPFISRQKVDGIYDQLRTIFEIAAKSDVSTHEAAITLADYRLQYHIGKRDAEIAFDHAGVEV